MATLVIIEEPEIVLVRYVTQDGQTIDVAFTREEYTLIQMNAAAEGVSIEDWLTRVLREESSKPPSAPKANPRGSA